MSNFDKLAAGSLGATQRLGAPREYETTEKERITRAIGVELDVAVKEIVRARHRCYARTPGGARDQFPDLVHHALVALLERIQQIPTEDR